MTKAFAALAVLYLFALVLSLSGNLYALPEYGVRYGQSCQLCHYSVSGGGSRTLYGAQFFSYTDLPSHPLDFDEISSINPMLNDRLQFGLDFRTFYYMNQSDNSVAEGNSFVTMQGDVYLSYQASDRTVVVLDKGLRNNFEAYAQTQALPWEMAAKAGRFMPNFGWRFADHTSFVRRFTGFGGTQGVGGEEDGFEIGHYNEREEISVALTNGVNPGPVDANGGKAITARAAKRFHMNALNVTVGGSYRYAELGESGPYTRYGGLFYGMNLGRLTFMGETDAVLTTGSGYVATHLLRYDIRRGVSAVTSYDFYEPDIDLQTGSYWRARVGVDYTPYGYVTFTPLLEFNHDPNYESVSAQIHMHLWF